MSYYFFEDDIGSFEIDDEILNSPPDMPEFNDEGDFYPSISSPLSTPHYAYSLDRRRRGKSKESPFFPQRNFSNNFSQYSKRVQVKKEPEEELDNFESGLGNGERNCDISYEDCGGQDFGGDEQDDEDEILYENDALDEVEQDDFDIMNEDTMKGRPQSHSRRSMIERLYQKKVKREPNTELENDADINLYLEGLCDALSHLRKKAVQTRIEPSTKLLYQRCRNQFQKLGNDLILKEDFNVKFQLWHKKKKKRVKCSSVYFDGTKGIYYVIFNKSVNVVVNFLSCAGFYSRDFENAEVTILHSNGNREKLSFEIVQADRGFFLKSAYVFRKKEEVEFSIRMENGKVARQRILIDGYCDAQFRKKSKGSFLKFTRCCHRDDILVHASRA